MITLENRFFPIRSVVCFLVEGGIILISMIMSFLILHVEGHAGAIGFNDAIYRGVVIAILCQMCMFVLDMYDLNYSQTSGEMIFSLIFAIGVVCIGIGIISYVVPMFGLEGEMYYLTIFFVAVLLVLWRIAFDIYLMRFAPKENVLIIGTGSIARLIGEEIRNRKRFGFQLVGFIGNPEGPDSPAKNIAPILSGYESMADAIRTHRVRKVIVALNERRGGYPVNDLLNLRVTGCKILEWPVFYERLSGRIAIDNLAPSYFIFQDGFRKSRFLLYTRRFVSLIFAVCLVTLLFPLLIVVAFLIKLDSPGPVFYTQQRVGQNGKVFRILKFRSMRRDAEVPGSVRWATKDDPRITRVGRIIRLARIDEVPQVINVLKGDIDIVGPRPERPEFVEELQRTIPYYALRHTIKPGLTGWAQVMFPYCGTVEESKEKLQYDLFYIKNMSLKLDWFIIIKTVKIVLLGRGAR